MKDAQFGSQLVLTNRSPSKGMGSDGTVRTRAPKFKDGAMPLRLFPNLLKRQTLVHRNVVMTCSYERMYQVRSTYVATLQFYIDY
jgi:hypothetical protein